MADVRRTSRADRRRNANGSNLPEGERRRPSPASVVIHSQIRDGELQIFVQSPITADNCLGTRATLMKHCQRMTASSVVLDLQKTTYLDTPGLSVIFEFKKELTAQGRTLCLQNPSRCVLRMLNITRMNRIFMVRHTNADAQRIPAVASATQPLVPPPALPSEPIAEPQA